MSALRLLERLRLQQKHPDHRGTIDEERVVQSVIEYVSKILNTRRGSTVLNENFGIPDFTNNGEGFSRDDIPMMETEIAEFISRYEPRLKNIQVSFLDDPASPLQIAFTMNAELYMTKDTMPIHLVTRMDPLGKVTVSQ